MVWEAERMKPIPFSEIRRILETATRMEKAGAKVIHLEIGRPDFDTPAHIKEAAKRALDQGLVHYTSNYGLPELRQAIARKLATDNGVVYDPQTEIIVTIGAAEAIAAAMTATLNPGDEVLIPEPAFLNYFHCARLAGARPVGVPLREEAGFELDPAELARQVTRATRMIVLSSPHNPTGAVFRRETLERVAEIACRHNLLVLADEVYEKIVYDDARHYSLASFPGMRERTVLVNGFSKTYSMTGWRLGYVAAPKALIDCLVRVHQYTVTCAVTFAQVGGVAALEGPQDCVAEMVRAFAERRRCLVEALNRLDGVSCSLPRGAFYVFANVRRLGRTSAELADYLLERAAVATVPGSGFGPSGEGYIRLSYANSLENIKEAMRRLEEALAKL